MVEMQKKNNRKFLKDVEKITHERHNISIKEKGTGKRK